MVSRSVLLSLPASFPCFFLLPSYFVKATRHASSPGLSAFRWHQAWPRKLVSYAVLAATLLLVLVPLWQILVLALEPARSGQTYAWRFPASPNLDNFYRLMTGTDFALWLAHSLLVALAVTALGLILAATAGYAISRFRFFARGALLNTLLVTQIFPATMLLLPIFIILSQLQLVDTFLGLGLIYLATVLPFSIWQMKSYYDSIPESIEEAAAMDGCTPSETFRRVVIPVAAPGLAVTALFSFAASWNEYVVAAIILQDSRLFTLPLGLRELQMSDSPGHAGLFGAGALFVTLPMLLLYLLLSRFLVARVQEITSRR